jgi:hypothetical protein
VEEEKEMNYKLAEKLKDVGFPSEKHKCWYRCEGTHCIPTLEELIEACGDGLEELKQIKEEDLVNYNWEAHADGFCVVGKTPTEAVAKLYIALNKKR